MSAWKAPTVVTCLPRASILLAHISAVAIEASRETDSIAKVSIFFAYILKSHASSDTRKILKSCTGDLCTIALTSIVVSQFPSPCNIKVILQHHAIPDHPMVKRLPFA